MKKAAREQTIRMLLAGATAEDSRAWRRMAAREAWARETVAALKKAYKKLDAAWARVFAALPDDMDEEELEALHLPDPPEQAEVDRLHAAIDAVIEHDKWPRELYFGCI